MPTKTPIKRDKYIRIPVILKDTPKDKDRQIALATKQAVEKREGRSRSWAYVVRLAFRALASVEGVKCK